MKDLRIVQKLTRRSKNTKQKASAFNQYDKTDKREEVLAGSPAAFKLAIKVQRRLDRQLGTDMVGQKPAIAFNLNVSDVERFDYDGMGDFGIRLTLAAGLIAASGMRPNDIVMVLEGEAKGKQLKVVAITDATHVRLEDIATYVGPETNIRIRTELSTVKASYN